MIIIQNPIKDTYVTDIQTTSNNAITSNVGQSSTIDLFKITGESNKTHSRGLIKFTDSLQPLDGENFTLIDSEGNTKTFEFDNENGVNGDNISINIGNDINETINNTIQEIKSVNDFFITPYKLYNNSILLKQDKTGVSGDTQIQVNGENIEKKDFVRFEHSAGLLEFDLSLLKRLHLPEIEKRNFSVFRDDTGDGIKFSASIKLIDVGKSSTRPKNFSLVLDVLKNKFKEGLGKDVVHFSDIDDANFVTINSLENIEWTNQGIVSGDDLFLDSQFSIPEININKGDENIEFDITEYVHEFFKETENFNKESFVVHFPTEYLFDNNTYFVKRFGSRNLKNKQYIPQLLLKIDDREIENIVTDKKRYFNNLENFYLLNIKGNKTSDFINLDENHVKLKFSFIGDEDLNIYEDIEPIVGQLIYNYKGEVITGIKKFTISNLIFNQINEDSLFNKSLNKLNYVPVTFEYFYENKQDSSITSIIKKDIVNIYKAETDYDEISFNNRNIRVSIDLLQKNLKANDSVVSLKISFIDTNKQYKSVNTKTQLYSEDIGKVTYEMYDVDTGLNLIKNEENFTQINFNGKHYIMNIFSSLNFKNKRVNFVFKYTDPLTGLDKKVSSDNTVLRFV